MKVNIVSYRIQAKRSVGYVGLYISMSTKFKLHNIPSVYYKLIIIIIIIITSIGTRSAFFFNESRRTKVPKLYSKESMSSGTF